MPYYLACIDNEKYRIVPEISDDKLGNNIYPQVYKEIYPDSEIELSPVKYNPLLKEVVNFIDSYDFVSTKELDPEKEFEMKKLCTKISELTKSFLVLKPFLKKKIESSVNTTRTGIDFIIDAVIKEKPVPKIKNQETLSEAIIPLQDISTPCKNPEIEGFNIGTKGYCTLEEGKPTESFFSVEEKIRVFYNELNNCIVLGNGYTYYFPELKLLLESTDPRLLTIIKRSSNEIFSSFEEAKKYIETSMEHRINSDDIKTFIKTNYIMSDDPKETVQFSTILDSVSTHFKLDDSYKKSINYSLPVILKDLGLSKKRKSDGMYWYGLKFKNSSITEPMPTSEFNEKLNRLTNSRSMKIK